MTSPEALQVMATWVASIADNVKNPIAGISAVLDLAEARLDDPEHVGSSLAQVRARLAALNEYVTELAEFSRPAVVRPAVTQLSGLITNALEAANLPPATAVTVDVADSLAARVDAAKLTLVMKALVRNAVEAVDPTRTPRLRITARTLSSRTVAVTVEDNGAGLSPELARQALEPFFSTKEAGTGLGLAVVRKYVEAHGGGISIDGSPALGGCRVTLTLPPA